MCVCVCPSPSGGGTRASPESIQRPNESAWSDTIQSPDESDWSGRRCESARSGRASGARHTLAWLLPTPDVGGRMKDLGCRVQGLGVKVAGCRVKSTGCRVQGVGVGCRVQGVERTLSWLLRPSSSLAQSCVRKISVACAEGERRCVQRTSGDERK